MKIPILMYHKVGAPVQSRADTFLNVSARSFARQMRLLQRMGYQGITFAEAAAGLRGDLRMPRRPVCVTFDDGYVSVCEHAAPILDRMGWPATIFLPTGYAGRANEWDLQYGNPILPIMDWESLRGLLEAGWEIAGHTRSHPKLGEMADEEAEREMRAGAQDIAQRLGSAPQTFCYPFGSHNDRTPALARQCGFRAACTTRSGLADPSADPFRLPRVKIAYRDDVWGLLYRLWIRPRLS